MKFYFIVYWLIVQSIFVVSRTIKTIRPYSSAIFDTLISRRTIDHEETHNIREDREDSNFQNWWDYSMGHYQIYYQNHDLLEKFRKYFTHLPSWSHEVSFYSTTEHQKQTSEEISTAPTSGSKEIDPTEHQTESQEETTADPDEFNIPECSHDEVGHAALGHQQQIYAKSSAKNYEHPIFDIKYNKNQLYSRSGASNRDFLWPGGNLNFCFDQDFGDPEADEVRKILTYLSTRLKESCYSFKFTEQCSGDHVLYVRSEEEGGCWSYLGRQGGNQTLFLGKGCLKETTVIHETYHALGFDHEHNRRDRDKYIEIHYENVIKGLNIAFCKNPNFKEIFTPFDYQSIMHYSATAFSANGEPTITAKNSKPIGYNEVLTDLDIYKMGALYGCKKNETE